MIVEAAEHDYKSLVSEGFYIVNFYSSAVQCRMFHKVLEELVCDYPFINVVEVNVTKYPGLGADNKVDAVPTALFVKDGEELEREVGIMEENEIEERISKYYYA